jgi:hypothetical protein
LCDEVPSAVGSTSIFQATDDGLTFIPTISMPIHGLAREGTSCLTDMLKTAMTAERGLEARIRVALAPAMPWCYSWQNVSGAPLLCLPVALPFYYPAPVVTVSGIRLDLGKMPKAQTVRLRFFVVTEPPRDWAKPPKCNVLIREPGKLDGAFETCGLTSAPKLEFPDCVRIFVDENSTKETAHILVHVRTDKLLKIGVIPLDVTQVPDNGQVQIGLVSVGAVPKDFMKPGAARPQRRPA